ncbi:ATP-dependent DNA helicase PIF1 [Apiospora arundinis]|uniref:ATP-dependent DNA helicase PIF1 n=1 Tax=Apiospora arundinis TaxID=335852 RepID=A0ABR2IXX7_9PEZI
MGSFVDDVFTETLDEDLANSAAQRCSKSAVAPPEAAENAEWLSTSFQEQAHFVASRCQVHHHSATCVKYSFKDALKQGGTKRGRPLCRFGAPWKLVPETGFTEDGLLQVGRNHPMVNRYNRSMVIGLRHNHYISLILTRSKGLSLMWYICNYATKLNAPMWKRLAIAAEVLELVRQQQGRLEECRGEPAAEEEGRVMSAVLDETMSFMLKMSNRVFSSRELSQPEVLAYLLGFGTDFSGVPSTCAGWVQKLRPPGKASCPVLDGRLTDHVDEQDANVAADDITELWRTFEGALSERLRFHVRNIILLRVSSDDATADRKLRGLDEDFEELVDIGPLGDLPEEGSGLGLAEKTPELREYWDAFSEVLCTAASKSNMKDMAVTRALRALTQEIPTGCAEFPAPWRPKSLTLNSLNGTAAQQFTDYWFNNATKVDRKWFIQIDASGGPMSAVASKSNNETAYAHRDKTFIIQFYDAVAANMTYPDNGLSLLDGWVSAVTTALQASGNNDYGAYGNYPDSTLNRRTAQSLYYGVNLEKLQKLKAKYDPGELFYSPQSVEPWRD